MAGRVRKKWQLQNQSKGADTNHFIASLGRNHRRWPDPENATRPNEEISSVWSRHLAEKMSVQMVKALASPEKLVRKTLFWPHTNLTTLMKKR